MRYLACAFAIGIIGGLVHAQEPGGRTGPTFTSGVHIVELDVRVIDAQGRFVSDLAAEDFELAEDGVPRPVEAVYLVNESAGPTAPAKASGAAASPAAFRDRQRQIWIFAFDLNHLPPGAGFERARNAVSAFIRERLRDGDMAGILAGSRMVNNRLTGVREELLAAVGRVKPLPELRSRRLEMSREWPPLVDEAEVLQIATEQRDAIARAVSRACTEDPGACRQALPELEIREKARRLQRTIGQMTGQTLAALDALASGLASVAGPKTVVLLSEGFVAAEMESRLRSVAGRMGRAGARVYAVDTLGLDRGRGSGILDQTATDGVGTFVQADAQEDGPNSLAIDTGGLVIRNENDLGRALQTIAADANRYYVLGFTPAKGTWDGAFRSVSVRVRRGGLRVRARGGYLALEPAPLLATARSTAAPSGAPAAAEPWRNPLAAAPLTALPGASVGGPPGIDSVAATAERAGRVRARGGAAARIKNLTDHRGGPPHPAAAAGWDAYQRGDVEAAIGPLAEAAADAQVRPWVLYVLGMSQAALGRPAEAIASWERVRQAAPEFEAVYADLADAYVQVADLTGALAVLREAQRRWPKIGDFHNAVGVIHVRRNALDAAIDAFSTAVTAAPEESLGYLNLARAYEMRFTRDRRYVSSQRRWVAPEGDRRKAAENYQKYVELGGPYAAQAKEALGLLSWR